MYFYTLTCQASRTLAQKTAQALSSARNFSAFGRKFSHTPNQLKPLDHQPVDRTVLVFKQTVDCESVHHMQHVVNMIRTFQQFSPSVRLVNKKDLERTVPTSQKIVLVVTGEDNKELMEELRDLAPKFRDAISKGIMNYFGEGAGAVFASRGYIEDDVEVDVGGNLGIANVMTTNYPGYELENRFEGGIRKRLKVIDQKGASFLVDPSSGPSLHILPNDVSTKVVRSIKKIADYTDDSHSLKLGSAVVKGVYGEGKVFLKTYTGGEDDADELSKILKAMNLREGAEYVLESSPTKS